MSISRLAARASAILFLLCVGLVIGANLGYAQSTYANLSGIRHRRVWRGDRGRAIDANQHGQQV